MVIASKGHLNGADSRQTYAWANQNDEVVLLHANTASNTQNFRDESNLV